VNFVHNLAPEIIFSNDKLHIILKLRNLEIGGFQLSFKSTLESGKLKQNFQGRFKNIFVQ